MIWRCDVVNLARSLKWRQWGNWRKYGPKWFQCYRRGNQFIWIGFETIECAAYDWKGLVVKGKKEPINFTEDTKKEIKQWLS